MQSDPAPVVDRPVPEEGRKTRDAAGRGMAPREQRISHIPAGTELPSGGAQQSRLPAEVQKVVRSRGRPLGADAQNFLKLKTAVDPSKIKIHTGSAADRSARSVRARAYTVGRHIVFGADQYRPRTRRGRHLLAHEAGHAARNRPNTIFRSAFDAEQPALRTRRRAAIRKARVVIQRLLGALSRGYIWNFEEIRSSGVYPQHMDAVETISNRASRLRGIVGAMILMARELETGPIPQDWLAATVSGAGGRLSAGSPDPAMTDVLMFYSHRAQQRGLSLDLIYNNVAYIMAAPVPRRAITPALISRGIPTGINIQVPDPVNEPLVYRRVTGFERLRPVGVILEVMHDSFGYYYLYRGRQHYLPERP